MQAIQETRPEIGKKPALNRGPLQACCFVGIYLALIQPAFKEEMRSRLVLIQPALNHDSCFRACVAPSVSRKVEGISDLLVVSASRPRNEQI